MCTCERHSKTDCNTELCLDSISDAELFRFGCEFGFPVAVRWSEGFPETLRSTDLRTAQAAGEDFYWTYSLDATEEFTSAREAMLAAIKREMAEEHPLTPCQEFWPS